MKLRSSPKIYKNYKSDFPENTINTIKKGLKKIGINVIYKEKNVSSGSFSSYSGKLIIDELGFAVEGKGITPELAKASAYAEMAERFSAGFLYFHIFNSNIEKYYALLENLFERKFLKGYCKDDDHRFTCFEEISKFFSGNLTIKKLF